MKSDLKDKVMQINKTTCSPNKTHTYMYHSHSNTPA